jgi:hypothetical protein
MAESKHLQRQVERILDEATESQVEVIIQVESDRGISRRLAQAAGEALSRQRLSLTPRDLLPEGYRKRITPQAKQETASTRTLLGRATAETLALAKIQQMGLNPMDSLLQNGIVRAALGRMVRPARRSARRQLQPSQSRGGRQHQIYPPQPAFEPPRHGGDQKAPDRGRRNLDIDVGH